MKPIPALAFLACAVLCAAALGSLALAQATSPQSAAPPGSAKSLETRSLAAGARVLQNRAPLAGIDVYLMGFHPLKDHPERQMAAHHYCRQRNEDFAQCMLFDDNTETANLNGVEYIISEKLYAGLPAQERQYWHPHNGEILSGQLVAPGIPAPAEKALMKQKMNSYGKTWHVWNTGHAGQPGDALPLGPPMLAWSFSRDGEILPGMVARRDAQLGVSTEQKRRERQDLTALARPQDGVDALLGRFGRPTRDIPGVRDSAAK